MSELDDGMNNPRCGCALWWRDVIRTSFLILAKVIKRSLGSWPVRNTGEKARCGAECRSWPIASFCGNAANGRFRGYSDRLPSACRTGVGPKSARTRWRGFSALLYGASLID
jgi:hypothetical protein